jgi:nucleotide-binding universal stress UspA family protein
MSNFNRVLVPTDFSDFSLAAVQYGQALATRIGAELHVLHVASPSFNEYVAQAGTAYRKPYDQFESELINAAESEMCRKLQEVDCLDVQAHITIGCAATEIMSFAESKAMDLIVMGTHGRTGLAHLLLGSVAERVVRGASCPVLTVRGTEIVAEMSADQWTPAFV